MLLPQVQLMERAEASAGGLGLFVQDVLRGNWGEGGLSRRREVHLAPPPPPLVEPMAENHCQLS